MKIDSTFEVTSGAVCYGSTKDIAHGEQQEIQAPTPLEFDSRPGGTILRHWNIQYNFAARNGRWNVYDTAGGSGAWFVCHSSLDPFEEAHRIVSVAGSPYNEWGSKNVTDAEAYADRVIIINRYDWCQGLEENSPGIRDYKKFDPGYWGRSWEYNFARFGLTPDKSAVHSFLVFGDETFFEYTTLEDDDRPLYDLPPEAVDQKLAFQRRDLENESKSPHLINHIARLRGDLDTMVDGGNEVMAERLRHHLKKFTLEKEIADAKLAIFLEEIDKQGDHMHRLQLLLQVTQGGLLERAKQRVGK